MAASASFSNARQHISGIGSGYMGDGTTGNVSDSFQHTKTACGILVGITEAQGEHSKALEQHVHTLTKSVQILQAQQAELLTVINELRARISTLESR